MRRARIHMTQTDKEFLEKQILNARFLPVTEDIFSLYDQYEALLDSKDTDGLAFLLCYKGETYLRIGDLESALNRLTRCTRAPKSATCIQLDALAYNLTGLAYFFLGYEVAAFENFQQCDAICRQHHLPDIAITCQLNLGTLYRTLHDYEKALSFYHSALSLIGDDIETHRNLYRLTLSYFGLTYCIRGDFSSAEPMHHALESLPDEPSFYAIATHAFHVLYFYESGEHDAFMASFDTILERSGSQNDFFEYFEFYYNVCQFLLGKNEYVLARKLLDTLKDTASGYDYSFFHYLMEKLEVRYAKTFGSLDDYTLHCSRFVESHKAYYKQQLPMLLHTMECVELLHKTKQDSARLEQSNRLDPMTGLFNKYTIEFLVQEKLRTSSASPFALLLVDMDYFKQINNKLGHLMGDSIIRDTANIIKKFFPEDALCGRVGGDEFLICITSFRDTSSVLLQAELLRQEICRLAHKRNLSVPTDASIGISFFLSGAPYGYTDLFHQADDALYHAKKSGRNKIFSLQL